MASYLRRVQIFSYVLHFFVICCLFAIAVCGPVNPAIGKSLNTSANNGNPPVPIAQQMAQDKLSKLNLGNQFRGGQPEADSAINKQKPLTDKHVMLASVPECQDDIRRFCDTDALRKNNFAILECLQADLEVQTKVSEPCQHVVWMYKQNLTKDDRFEMGASQVCRKVFEDLPECRDLTVGTGQRIPCLIEFMDNITDTACHNFLNKMANIVFGDYHLVYHFMENCQNDVVKFKCGRLADSDSMHSQGQTIVCLAKHITDLDKTCKKQVLRVAELQSDDYHLDRGLYFACRDAREIFCENVHAGGGKVFECLFKNKMDERMPDKCRELLRVRQQLIAEDVKVKKTFYDACYKDIKFYNCMSSDMSVDGEAARATILLCLENALKKDQKVSGQCVAEMRLVRQSLMEDYQITPEIVCHCGEEIDKFCKREKGLDKAGSTIHCLMQHANLHERQREELLKHKQNAKTIIELEKEFRPECKRSIEDLLKEADVAEDVTIDRALAEACSDALADCQGNKASIMNCLMEKVETDDADISEACEDKLLEIQFFVVRDFRLDPMLFRACHDEAKGMCGATDEWFNVHPDPTVERDPDVFPCLYRHLPSKIKTQREKILEEGGSPSDTDPELKVVGHQCERELRRVMKQRATSINLEPEIEEKCLHDLGALCSDLEHYGHGEEMRCLQDHYEDITGEECREEMKKFIEDEDEDLDLDRILMKACTPMIKKFCNDLLKKDTEAGDIMGCLIENKNEQEMNDKCRAGIEHHQIIQMKEFSFTHTFKEACKKDVMEHCDSSKSKAEIVACLSETIRNDVLQDKSDSISMKCRKQLRVEVLRMGEDIKLDPGLELACKSDIGRYCLEKHAGNAQITECLREHKTKLTPKCHNELFQKEMNEAAQGGDFLLFKTCKQMIKNYCKHKDPKDIFRCLKNHMNENEFDQECKAVILKRAMEDTKDYRLNPGLTKACRLDIPKFCKEVIANHPKNEEYEGKIINCLKVHFIKKELSKDCYFEIRQTIQDVHLDINMDPVLMHACQSQIKTYCSDVIGDHEDMGNRLKFQPNDDTGDKVKNCLEEKFMEGKIKTTTECGREISRIIEEVQIDVHIDPELNAACQNDLVRFCREFESGQGQKMSCLLQIFEDHPDGMLPKCATLLSKRKTLWEYAAKIAPPESFSEIHQQIMASPAKHYLLGVLMVIIGMIFIVGITCGRVTKRVTREQKNK